MDARYAAGWLSVMPPWRVPVSESTRFWSRGGVIQIHT